LDSGGKLVVVDGAGVTRVDPNGSNASVLISDPEASIISMSVCGNNYLLLSWPGHGSNAGNVWRTNADGSAAQKLSSGVFDCGAACSPDGKWVYYIEFPNTSRLMRVPTDGGKAEPVAGANVRNQFGIEGIAAIAPDGKELSLIVDVVDPVTSLAHAKLATIALMAPLPPRPV
jgi:sugar lactone lactonase YvrE